MKPKWTDRLAEQMALPIRFCQIALLASFMCQTTLLAQSPPPGVVDRPKPPFERPMQTGLFIGPEDNPEVNINRLLLGPRGWIFGCTEENGWLFILDPKTRKVVQWNAGRTRPEPGGSFEGDITDFVVWEESGQVVIVACQALPPADIFRYELPIPEKGLPDIRKLKAQRTYRNARWGRVMSIGEGRSKTGKRMLLAGSYGDAGLIRSDDGGQTWNVVDYWKAVGGLDGEGHRRQLSGGNASISEIHYVEHKKKGIWILFLYHAFVFADEMPWSSGERHCMNGILVSRDGGESWDVARVPPRKILPAEVQKKVQRELREKRLHPHFYGLVGEVAHSLAVLPDGSYVAGTVYDNVSKPVFGGRILRSRDGGLTWEECFQFEGKHDVRVTHVGGGILLAGTTTHLFPIPRTVKEATGDLYVSTDGGRTFRFLTQVVRETKPANLRRPQYTDYFYTGVGAITSTERLVVVGTVNESGRAEIVLLPRRP